LSQKQLRGTASEVTTKLATKSSHGRADSSDGICALLAIRLRSIIVSLNLPHATNGRFKAMNSCDLVPVLAGMILPTFGGHGNEAFCGRLESQRSLVFD
jgi:hypothetical protein